MTTKDKLNYLIQKGFTMKDGEVYSHKGKSSNGRILRIDDGVYNFGLTKSIFVWYFNTGIIPSKIDYIDGDSSNYHIENLKEHIPTEAVPIQITRTSRQLVVKKNYTIDAPKPLHYINDNELMYHIIISKGKGQPTKELEIMLIDLATKLARKFNYRTYADYLDCRSGALLRLFTSWQMFDELKYDKALPYLTELSKRAMAKTFNELNWKENALKERPRLVRFVQ